MIKQLVAGVLALSLLGSSFSTALASPPKKWINVNVNEEQEEEKSLFNSEHYDFVKYSKIGAKLKEIERQSNRVQVEVTGQSADGRDLYVVTISDPAEKGRYGKHQSLRKQMFKNPEKAQDWVDKHPDFKVPIMINASIHGTEFVGTDAALQLIERFAFANDEETKRILESNILIINVVANPDGRVKATRFNGAGIDLNRDFITQSQPETRQIVELITTWHPLVLLDLHGYVNWFRKEGRPGLIEPCTPPHNPNYQYDLFIKWALDQAEAMEQEIVNNRENYEAEVYQNMIGTYIPYRDDTDGWDDYPPIFTPMYAMYHGAYAYTLEAPTNDWDGVRWTYDAVMGALKFATENRNEMLKDQIEMFKRGINFDHPYHHEGFFPKAYILPVDETDPTVTLKAVCHLQANDIEVEEAKQSFTIDGKTYPAGTFIVKLDQAKAGLINTMLWEGEDITDIIPTMYDISAWSLPLLWGFEAVPTHTEIEVVTSKVNNVQEHGQLVGQGPYLIPNTSVKAVELVNKLLQSGIKVHRDLAGNFYVEAQKGNTLKALVKDSGLTLQSAVIPEEAKELKHVKVAILKDGGMNKQQSHAGTRLALERLGFEVTELHPREVAAEGLQGYDVFIYSATEQLLNLNLSEANQEFGLENQAQLDAFREHVGQFVDNGGKFIAVGAGGSLAAKSLGLTGVTVKTGGRNSNGIVKVTHNRSQLTSGYEAEDIGFVYRPVWYTDVNKEKVNIISTFADTPDFFMSGHWKDNEEAKGQAVIVEHRDKDVTLIGLEAGFRDHTDYLFRLLSNAIFK